jgi:hypothetical protein
MLILISSINGSGAQRGAVKHGMPIDGRGALLLLCIKHFFQAGRLTIKMVTAWIVSAAICAYAPIAKTAKTPASGTDAAVNSKGFLGTSGSKNGLLMVVRRAG